MGKIKSESSFTLIELVIVIGILAVLAVVVILTINPSEFLKSARDSTRMSNLQTINKSLGLYQADGGSNFGSTNKVYVSIPDDTSQTCASLGLPSLPSNWEYRCSNSTNYRKVDSNGWIPVNLTSITFGSTLDTLPIDPVNTTSTGNYYTYVVGGSWEMTALFESDKYADKAINDGDAYPGVYNLRTSVSVLTPGIRDKGLAGYWKFDETSGTLYDSSGHGNNGTQSGGVTYGATGKVANALSFDGVDDRVKSTKESISFAGTYDFTWSAWIYPISISSGAVVSRQALSDDYLGVSSGKVIVTRAQTGAVSGGSVPVNQWSHIVGKGDSQKLYVYLNGVLVGSGDHTTPFTAGFVAWYAGCLHDAYVPPSLIFTGLIDDVRIYNRALSAAEIAAIYNATR